MDWFDGRTRGRGKGKMEVTKGYNEMNVDEDEDEDGVKVEVEVGVVVQSDKRNFYTTECFSSVLGAGIISYPPGKEIQDKDRFIGLSGIISQSSNSVCI